MKTFRLLCQTKQRTFALVFMMLFGLHFLQAAPQDVDLTGANPNPAFEYNFNLGVAIPATTFGVLNATGNVFWEFASIPGGAVVTPTSFTLNGITITLPGSSSTAVSNALTASITGTPSSSLSISFTVTVADELDPTRTRNREYELIINQPMDMVLVLDRSGSMGRTTAAGVTRWQALTTAAGNFANELAALGRVGDRIGISYFHSTVAQPSIANFPTPLINVNAATINTELSGQGPGGSTAMGAGMKDGQGKVTDVTRMRYLVLFTDGAQNVPPSVNSNGRGYSDGTPLNSSYPAGAGSIKVFTIGIDGPGGPDLTTLQNLATENRGNYVGTDDGAINVAFTSQFANSLSSSSPQLINSSTINTSNSQGPFTLQSFPLNKRIDKLLVELTADKKFEVPQLAQWLARISIEKDGVPVTNRAKPTWVGNYSNTILLTFDFKNLAGSGPAINPEGNWVVKLADVTALKMGSCASTSIADDHRLDYSYGYGNASPRVNTALKPFVTLSWLGHPITDATVKAVILRPGQDLGDFLANNPLKVDVSNDPDAVSPGAQKYDQLWANDKAFRAGLDYQENTITLTHTADGRYEGDFNGLTVAGNYRIVYQISGEKPETGKYQRFATESIYVSFNGIDLGASAVQSQVAGNKLVMTIKPKTSYGKLLGPAFGTGFTVDNPNVKIENVVDNQDGSYSITFTGAINEQVSLKILDQEIYKGKLSSISSDKPSGGIGGWLESIGLPGWSIWLILLLLAFLLWLIFKKKK